MPEAEKLPVSQPAEVYVDGIPLIAGEISASLQGGLLMSDARPMRGKKTSQPLKISPGDEGDLVFKVLVDTNGAQLVVPITIINSEDWQIALEFRDQISVATGEVLRQLKASSRETQDAATSEADAASASSKVHTSSNESVLAEFRKRSLHQIDEIINSFLKTLIDHLFELSSRPQSKGQQEEHYETMNIIKQGRDNMRSAFAESIEILFNDPVKPVLESAEQAGDTDTGELNLVDLHDFEDSLSLTRMTRMGQDKYSTALECLTLRFAELADLEPDETRLPIDVAPICEAFNVSLSKNPISHTLVPEVFAFFTQEVVRKLEGYYAGLNAYLREQNIQADIEEELEKNGSILDRLDAKKKGKKNKQAPETAKTDEEAEAEHGAVSEEDVDGSAAATATAGSPPTASAGQPSQSTSGAATQSGGAPTDQGDEPTDAFKQQFNPDDLYHSVIEALNFRRESNSPGMPGRAGNIQGSASNAQGGAKISQGSQDAAAGMGNMAGTSALANALTALQGNGEVRNKITGDQPEASLRQYLSEHQASISELEGTQGFAPENLNQLDLVDNLFNDLSSEIDVTPDLKHSVGDLQIPLAKLALLEPQFFADRKHPARGVIDKVAQLSDSANYPNRALESRVTGIIDNIVDSYKDDSAVFQTALTDLDKLSDQQLRALERNVERVVKTQNGKQKLEKAQKAVDKVLTRRLRPPHAPKPIVDLVDSGWRDLLTLTHVKQGPNSKAWKEYIKTLDLLSLWLIEKQKGDVSEQMQVERALEAEPFIDMVRQQISEALPSNLAHEQVLDELSDVLSGKAQLELVEVAPPVAQLKSTPEEVRDKVETLPRLRRWIKRVEDLQQGSWLSFKDKDGTRKRMQLAWISEDKDKYIFVNERGQKVAEMTGVQLARHLSRGVKAPSQAEALPLVDQSMYKTLEHVTKSLSFEKNHDDLTQLINKETFVTQVDAALNHAKSKHATHALLCLDIDKFELVNEVYDELTADQVLIEFAGLLSQQHDKKFSSARLQGDTFGVLMLDRTLDQALTQAESIRKDIEQSPVTIENDKVSFTVSIGVNTIEDHTTSVEEAMDHASLAVKQAKSEGRNKVVLYEQDANRVNEYEGEQAAAIADIEHTLDSKNFVLQAQPIAKSSAAQQAVFDHYEVLLALEDDDGKLNSPQEFINTAERFGYMTEVDRWVVKQVFTWICEMMDEQKIVPNLSINLSGNSITDDKFLEYLFEQISEYGVGTNKICFEITETGSISNMVKATDFVNEFKNIGCKFSIDDFGTGLASHSYLRELPVDYVKIDGTFIANIHKSPKDYAMAKSINDLAHFLGQETIAEFAENDEIIAKLCEMGVDYVQGWGVGKPTPLKVLAGQLDSLEK